MDDIVYKTSILHQLPADLSPINIKAYFCHNFGACGCSDLEAMIITVRDLMEWHASINDRKRYSELYDDEGIFYLLVGKLDDLGLGEHGTAIRHPWLTQNGKRLLEALRNTEPSEIENATGTAYDGLYYPDNS